MNKKRLLIGLLVIWAGVMSLRFANFGAPESYAAENRPAPAFTQSNAEGWINSSPLSWDDLKGKVVLLDIWTFDCWNCYRSYPWLKDLERRHADKPFQVVGIHSPEFDHERDREAVEAKVVEFELHHPVMLDNDFAYWKALGNRFWPTYYLVDKRGQIRSRFIGETHIDSRRAKRIEKELLSLLSEPA